MNTETILVNQFKQGQITLEGFVDAICESSKYYDNSLTEYYEEEETYEEFINRLESEEM